MLLTLVGDVGTLAETVVLLLLFVFISTNVAVLVLRKDESNTTTSGCGRGCPCSGWRPASCCSRQQSGQVWLYAALLLAVGVVLYFVARATGRRTGRDHEAGRIH